MTGLKSIVLRTLLLTALLAPSAAQAVVPNESSFVYSFQWAPPLIGLQQAWDHTFGSPSVKVAILDTGVNTTIPDLQGRLLPALSATGTAPFSNAQLDATDTLHHGTWTASVIGAGVNNGIGMAGVGNFSILPITVTDDNGFNSSEWIAQGIRMAADQGARVISISQSTLSYDLLDSAAAYARSKGALTFIASGNTNSRFDYGNLPNLIMVGGTNQADARWVDASNSAVGSTWGPMIDLTAPSENIVVADSGVGFGLISGTSFAAPMAGGVAALAWSINPNLTPSQVEQMLYSSAIDLGTPGWDEQYGWGRINANGVVLAALATVPEPSSLFLIALGGCGLIAWRRAR